MEHFCKSAYTADGFLQLPSAPKNGFTLILKGYPSGVRQTILERARDAAEEDCELRYDACGGLTMVTDTARGLCVLDGTYPCAGDAQTYGVTDRLFDLSAFLHGGDLRDQAQRVRTLLEEIRREERRCAGYLQTCAGILGAGKRIAAEYTDAAKLNRFCASFWKKHGQPPCGRIGTLHTVFGTALKGSGIGRCDRLFGTLCDDILVIRDWAGNAADPIIEKLGLYARSSGLDVLACADILRPSQTPEHLLIPAMRLGIYRGRDGERTPFPVCRRIRAKRFLTREPTEQERHRASFSKKAYAELLTEASRSVRRILDLRHALDLVYLPYFDSAACLAAVDNLIKKC